MIIKNCFIVFVIDLYKDYYKENFYLMDIVCNLVFDVLNFGNLLEIF